MTDHLETRPPAGPTRVRPRPVSPPPPRRRSRLPRILLLLVLLGLAAATATLVINIDARVWTAKQVGIDVSQSGPAKQPGKAATASGSKTKTASQPDFSKQAAAVVQPMSMRQKVGQLFMVATNQLTPQTAQTYRPGSLIYFGNDLEKLSPAQVASLSKRLQQLNTTAGSKLPLLIATDQEGGNITRLQNGATQFSGNMALGAAGSTELTQAAARASCLELRAAGINFNLAPVADVNYNANNPVIGERSFGDKPHAVTKHVAATVDGCQSAGIASAVKHFPGHGNTTVDSHSALPIIEDPEFSTMNLPPFQRVAKSADAVMPGHIAVPSLDPSGLPATLSRPMLTELLRNKMGFRGVVVTDELTMAGVVDKATPSTVALKALMAGADMLMVPTDLGASFSSIIKAAKANQAVAKRVNESAVRIVQLKLKLGLNKPSAAPVPMDPRRQAQRLAARIAAKSITVVKPATGFRAIPSGQKVLVTGWGQTTSKTLASFMPSAVGTPLGTEITPAESASIATQVKGYDAVIVVTYGLSGIKLAGTIMHMGKPVYVVPLGAPYQAAPIKGAKAVVTGYSYQAVALQAVAAVLTGKAKATGTLPVRP